MTFDFDSFTPRHGRNTDKWDGLSSFGLDPETATPMWVADMDFKSPPAVAEVARDMAEHGYFGYHYHTEDFQDAASAWMAKRHDWQVDPRHIMTTHGIVNAVAIALSALSEKGDGVAIFTPVYHAFARVVNASDRDLIELPLRTINDRFELDWDHYDSLITPKTKVLILCSPHNPAGRIWSPDELRQTYAFAEKHNLMIINDEIHHDIIMPGATFTTFANAVSDSEARTITLTSPSKTFNIAGNHTGNAIIPNAQLRKAFKTTMRAHGIGPNMFGIAMGAAAYRHGEEWLDALLPYLADNLALFHSAIDQIPGARLIGPMQSTYLAWVDFSDLGMPDSEVIQRIQTTARIATSHGPTFGTGGAQHLRFNLGLPRHMLAQAMERMIAAFADIQ